MSMCGNEKTFSTEKLPELKNYKRRWIILTLTSFYLFSVGYGRACFGVVENVYAEYFSISVEAVDWLTLSMFTVGLLMSLLLLLILPSFSIGFRLYCQITVVALVLSFGCHFASAFFRRLFAVALLGQILIGIAGAIAVIVIPQMASLWFPKEEIATAVGIALGGIAVGNMVGFLLPAHLLQRQTNISESLWAKDVEMKLTIIFSIFLGCSIIAMAFTFLFVIDQPETPPSLSEYAKRQANENEKSTTQSLRRWNMKYLRLAWNELVFIALAICFGITETAYMLEVVMIADILRFTRGETRKSTKSNVLASYYLTSYAIGAFLGGIWSGYILDKTKKFKVMAIVSGVLMTLFASGFLTAVWLKSTVWSIVTNFFYGVFNGSCYTCLYEIIVQHMYPCNEMALGAWITLFVSFFALFVPLIGRHIYNAGAELGVLVLQCAVLLVATIVISFVKTNYARHSINSQGTETEQLVSKNIAKK